jgi:hypothetical protein
LFRSAYDLRRRVLPAGEFTEPTFQLRHRSKVQPLAGGSHEDAAPHGQVIGGMFEPDGYETRNGLMGSSIHSLAPSIAEGTLEGAI